MSTLTSTLGAMLRAALAELVSWREDGLLSVIDSMLTPVTLAVMKRATPPGAGEE